MTGSGGSNDDVAGGSEATPPIGYVGQFDDADDPSEFTVSDPNATDTTTHWLTIDADHAVSRTDWR